MKKGVNERITITVLRFAQIIGIENVVIKKNHHT